MARGEEDPELFLLWWRDLATGDSWGRTGTPRGSLMGLSSVILLSLCRIPRALPHRHPLLWVPCRSTLVFEILVRPVSFLRPPSLTRSASPQAR